MADIKKQTPDNGTQEEEEIVDPTLTKKDLEEEEEIQEFNPDGTPKEEDEEEDEEEEEEEIPDPTPTPTPDPKPKVVTPPKEDWRTKFANSTRRNQIVESQFKELQKTLGDITKQEIPSDEEMKIIDPDWEYRSDFEKNLLVKQVVMDRRQNLILNSISNITKESEEVEKLGEFIDSVPELKGKESQFIEFTRKPSNKGASVEVLLSAFLYSIKDELPPEDPTPKPEEIPPSLERATPTGGDAPKPKTGFTDEELKNLRTKNPKKYFKLIREGKI